MLACMLDGLMAFYMQVLCVNYLQIICEGKG